MDLGPSCMRIGPAFRTRLDHVDPYKLTHGQLYISNTYIVFIHSNARACICLVKYNAHSSEVCSILKVQCDVVVFQMELSGHISCLHADNSNVYVS
jgi:hypothetical protein